MATAFWTLSSRIRRASSSSSKYASKKPERSACGIPGSQPGIPVSSLLPSSLLHWNQQVISPTEKLDMSLGVDRVCVIIGRTRHKMMQIELEESVKRGAKFIELRLDFLAK